MLVQQVVIPGSGARSWTVLGDDDVPVVPVDRFLPDRHWQVAEHGEGLCPLMPISALVGIRALRRRTTPARLQLVQALRHRGDHATTRINEPIRLDRKST